MCFVFFFKQKTAYEMRISDWSSDVCSSDLAQVARDEGADIIDAAAERQADYITERPRDEDEGDDREEQPGVEHRQAGNAFLQPGRGRDQEAGDDPRRDRPAQRAAARKAAQPRQAPRTPPTAGPDRRSP